MTTTVKTNSDWKVKFIDYPSQFRNMEKEIMDKIHSLLSKGDLMMRQDLTDFETNFAEFVGTKYAVGVSNCTDGLHLSLRAAGIKEGDDVLTVSHTFVATAGAIHHAGANPVFVDIDEDHNMNANLLEKALTPKTKAIVPVHLNGRICPMDKILDFAEKKGLIVIEDSAQGLGASFNGKRGGSMGLAGCFSFYPAKLLGAFGDAGAVTTNSEAIAKKVKSLRDHGRNKLGGVDGWSFNCRMDNLQAAVLNLRLKKLPDYLQRRRELASLYSEYLADIKELKLPPAPEEGGIHHDVFQNYEIEAKDKDNLVAFLKASGIEILIPWGGKGVHQLDNLDLPKFDLPRTDQLFEGALMLPLQTELTDTQIKYVSEKVHEFYGY